MKMKRKVLLIGNTRGLSDTPLDLLHVAKFLMSYQGGAWNADEMVCLLNNSAADILKEVEKVKDEANDYVIVYFTGHGGLQGDTIIEVNPANELLSEKSLLGLSERQLNVMDCCRDVQTTPLPIYGSSRGMGAIEKDLRDKVRLDYERLVMGSAPQLVRMYSCSVGESSYETGRNGSFYTCNLIGCTKDLLKTNDVVRVYQCHAETAIKTAADVLRERGMNQHPDIIPTKCLAQAELPIAFNSAFI